jgi:hypothetical protein
MIYSGSYDQDKVRNQTTKMNPNHYFNNLRDQIISKLNQKKFNLLEKPWWKLQDSDVYFEGFMIDLNVLNPPKSFSHFNVFFETNSKICYRTYFNFFLKWLM